MEDNQLKACRSAFEEWAEDKSLSCIRKDCGDYLYERTACAWAGWQACYNRPQANTEAPTDPKRHTDIILDRNAYEYAVICYRNCEGDFHDALKEGIQGYKMMEANTEASSNLYQLLNPDMPDQELRLHMGELTVSEVRVARAAIAWANTRMEANTEAEELAKGLLEIIDSQKQTHDALIKKVKIATDALQRLSLITDQYQSTAIARTALSQIQQDKQDV